MEFASKNFTIGQLNSVVKKLGGEEATKRFLQGKTKVVEVEETENKLLESLGTVVVPATKKKFVVKNEFVDGKNDINWIGKNIDNWFSNTIEEPVGKTEFRQSTLLEGSVDNPIIAELGGKKKVKAYFSQILSLMRNVLKRDGTVYIFYAETDFSKDEKHLAYKNEKGKKVVLRAVGVRWGGDGWSVDAYSVELPFRWLVDSVVFSRNS